MNPLEIKKPCGENWGQMQIGLISRHCNKCEKEVVDFTAMSKSEIFQYLYEHRGEKTCARLYVWQVDYSYQDVQDSIQKLSADQKKSPYFYFLLALAAFAIGSCNYENKPINTHVVETIQVQTAQDTVMLVKDSAKTLPKIKKVKPVQYVAEPDPSYIIQGELPSEIWVEDPVIDKERIYNMVQNMPEFYGGVEVLKQYVQSRIENIENENNISGKIIVNFVVDENGVVSRARIVHSTGGLKQFEASIIKIFNEMPRWKAGVQNGQTVKVEMNFPVMVLGD